jgi:DNA-binding NarL/FixJ family response regulator
MTDDPPAGVTDRHTLPDLDDGPADEIRKAARELVVALRHRPGRDSASGPGSSNLLDLAKASRRLRQLSRPQAILVAGCEEAATVSGLGRTVISAVAEGTDGLVVKAAHGLDDSAADLDRAAMVGCADAEVEAIATATPRTVTGPSAPNGIGSLVGHPHVVMPVMHGGTAIGLLHAAHDQPREIDETAIAGLAAFAAMLSTLWYCAAIEVSWHDHLRAVRQSMAENLDKLTIEPPEDLGALEPEDEPRIVPRRVADELQGRALTPREKVVLRHLLDGSSNRDIADELVLTVDTVKSHVKRILRKTGSSNRAELIHRASQPT